MAVVLAIFVVDERIPSGGTAPCLTISLYTCVYTRFCNIHMSIHLSMYRHAYGTCRPCMVRSGIHPPDVRDEVLFRFGDTHRHRRRHAQHTRVSMPTWGRTASTRAFKRCMSRRLAHIYTHAYAHAYTHVCTYVYTHVCAHACVHVCMHVHRVLTL